MLRIYITTIFKGKVSGGRGIFYIAGGPTDQDDIKGFGGTIKDISMPRFNAEVCNIAAKNIAEGMDAEVILQDPYAYSIISAGKCDGANKDIWDEFFEHISKLNRFIAKREPHHAYEHIALKKMQNGASL